MLYNHIERETMRRAIQPRLQGFTNRYNQDGTDLPLEWHFALIGEFLEDSCFAGKRVLELGPGQCDFLDIARAKGATTFGADLDPAIADLGKLRGHTMTCADLSQGWPYQGEVFDGLYSRCAFNIFWYRDIDMLCQMLDDISASMAPGAWLFFFPWNSPYNHPDPEPFRAAADEWLEREAIEVRVLDKSDRDRLLLSQYDLPRPEIWHKRPRVVGALSESR